MCKYDTEYGASTFSSVRTRYDDDDLRQQNELKPVAVINRNTSQNIVIISRFWAGKMNMKHFKLLPEWHQLTEEQLVPRVAIIAANNTFGERVSVRVQRCHQCNLIRYRIFDDGDPSEPGHLPIANKYWKRHKFHYFRHLPKEWVFKIFATHGVYAKESNFWDHCEYGIDNIAMQHDLNHLTQWQREDDIKAKVQQLTMKSLIKAIPVDRPRGFKASTIEMMLQSQDLRRYLAEFVVASEQLQDIMVDLTALQASDDDTETEEQPETP